MQNTFYNYRMNHDFDEEKKSKWKRNVLIIVVLVLSMITAYLVYRSYMYSTYPKSLEDIKLLESSIGPVKIAPVDAGGEIFDNQDKLIYSNIGAAFEKEDQALKSIASEVGQNEDPTLRAPAIAAPKPKKAEAAKAEPLKSTPKPIEALKEIPKQATQPKQAQKAVTNPFDLLEE